MSASPANSAATVEVPAGVHRTGDGDEVAATIALPLALHAGAIDRAAFDAAVGPGKTVAGSAGRLADLLKADAERAAAKWFAGRSGDSTDAVLAAADALAADVLAGLKVALFKLGLMPAGEAKATLSAPSVERRRAAQAAIDAAKSADKRAGELLLRFEDIRRQNPGVSPGELLMALPEGERYDTLRLLLEAAADSDHERAAPPLVVAAGESLFELEGDRLVRADGLDTLAGLGPIRSLRRVGDDDGSKLLVGCRDGVCLVGGEGILGEPRRSGEVGSSPRGFSDTALTRHTPDAEPTLWGVHGDVGLEVWPPGTDAGIVAGKNDLYEAFAEAAALALPTADLFAEPSNVLRVAAIAANGGPSPDACTVAITSKAANGRLSTVFADAHAKPDHGRLDLNVVGVDVHAAAVMLVRRPNGKLLAVLSDGGIREVDPSADLDGDLAKSRRAGLFERSGNNRVCAAAAVPWLGDVRLAMALEDGPIVVAGPDDDVWIEYHSDHNGFAAVAASAGRLAAVTGDRQRLVVWNPGQPDAPILDLYALGTTRSRVADVAFL